MSRRLPALLLGLLIVALGACQRGRSTSPATPTSPAHGPADIDGSLQSGGLTRTYHVHLPAGYSAARPAPLVLAFHGGGGDGAGMSRLTHLSDAADRFGFVVVYPDGYQQHWGDGRGVTPSERDGVDDVAFVAVLLDTLASQFAIDTRRVYATGISNGGFFSERLACDLSARISAIASVAATMSANLAARCAPARPVPYLLIHGTADPIVPYDGGQVGGQLAGERGAAISAADSVQKWAVLDGCPSPPHVAALPDTAHDGTQVRRTVYTGCATGSQVQFYSVEGGGHTWPGGLQYLPVAVVGKTSRQIDAGDVIWGFFAQFSLPS